jgi:hypothetical protein
MNCSIHETPRCKDCYFFEQLFGTQTVLPLCNYGSESENSFVLYSKSNEECCCFISKEKARSILRDLVGTEPVCGALRKEKFVAEYRSVVQELEDKLKDELYFLGNIPTTTYEETKRNYWSNKANDTERVLGIIKSLEKYI